MTAPGDGGTPPADDKGKTPPPAPPADDKGKNAPPAPPADDTVGLLSVVSYTRTNPVTRREHRAVGVVVDVDAQGVTVVPCEHGHTHRVALDDVAVLTGDDVVAESD